jgi:acetyl esterase/lipase
LAFAKVGANVPIQKDLSYGKVGDVELKYDFAKPLDGKGPFPFVICLHAGGWQLGDRKSFREDIVDLAKFGYAGATVDYRLTPSSKWPAQLDDLRMAVRYFRSHAKELNIDPKRFGAMGDDAGGHLALMLALTSAEEEKGKPLEESTRLQAVVNFFGPTDLREWRVTSNWVEAKIRVGFLKSSEQIIEDFLGTRDRTAPIYVKVSPISHITPDAPPILSFIGSADPLVSPEQPKAFHEALRKAGGVGECVVVEGAEHNLDSFKKDATVDPRWRAFFAKHLKGEQVSE